MKSLRKTSYSFCAACCFFQNRMMLTIRIGPHTTFPGKAAAYMAAFGNSCFTMPVDRDWARRIADMYFQNGAWTWSDDYIWFAQECFVSGPLEEADIATNNSSYPLNFLRVPFKVPGADSGSRARCRRLLLKADRIFSFTKATSINVPTA
jgi:hypothetical protein